MYFTLKGSRRVIC